MTTFDIIKYERMKGYYMENKELNNENIQSNNPAQSEQPNFSQIFNVESEEQQPVQQVQTEETEQLCSNCFGKIFFR